MDPNSDIREFLASCRAKITPQQAGPPACGSNRRVPGLRRGEVALLAGASIDHYARLERGHLAGASDEVLGALAGALRLDEAGRAHLHDLARAAGTRAARRTGRTRGPIPAGVHGTTRAARPHPTAYCAEPHTPAYDALRLQAAWAATEDTLAATTTRTEEQQS